MCVCKRRRKDHDSDNDSAGEEICLSSVTLFDIADIEKSERKVELNMDRKADTLNLDVAIKCYGKRNAILFDNLIQWLG